MGPRAGCGHGVLACGSTVTPSSTPAQQPASAAGISPACPGVLGTGRWASWGGPAPAQCGRAGATGTRAARGWAAALFNKITDAGVSCGITQHQDVVGEDGQSASRAGGAVSIATSSGVCPTLAALAPPCNSGARVGSRTEPHLPPGLGDESGPAGGHRAALTASGTEHGLGPQCFHPARGSVGTSRDRPVEQVSAHLPGVFCSITLHSGPGDGTNTGPTLARRELPGPRAPAPTPPHLCT